MDSETKVFPTTKGTSRIAQGICLAGFVVTAITLVGMTLALVQPAYRSDWFWFRVFWLVFLSALCWGSVYGFLCPPLTGRVAPKGAGGVMPVMTMIVFCYSLASVVLMIAQALLSRIEWLSRVHLAVQIGMGGIAAVMVLLLVIPVLQAGKDGRHQNPRD
jgi:hypothetical protein